MLNQIKKFVLDESGLETVEWAIVGGVITAAGVTVFLALGANSLRGLTSLEGETSVIP